MYMHAYICMRDCIFLTAMSMRLLVQSYGWVQACVCACVYSCVHMRACSVIKCVRVRAYTCVFVCARSRSLCML